jgi:hypothetical protein
MRIIQTSLLLTMLANLTLLVKLAFTQPAWVTPSAPAPSQPAAPTVAPAPSAPALLAPAPASKPIVKYKDRIVRQTDTLLITDTLVITKIDTVEISVLPIQYKYKIRYALTKLNVEITNPEWLDYASYNEIIARDTATLKMGVEEIRTLGNTIDQFGNHIPQTDIITTGFIINVFGNRATIEYRGKTSIAVFSGGFDNSGFLLANGEITETSMLASFFPFNLFFGSQKKRIIIEIIREAYL